MKPLTILFEDDYLMAIDKPSGVLCIPDRNQSEESIFAYLKRKYDQLYLVHRIDRETSGVFLLAKTEESQRSISKLFESHRIQKKYIALVHQSPIDDEGRLDNFLEENPNLKGSYRVAYHQKGKRAISNYKVLEKFKRHSLIEFEIETGRTHQIRVHASFLGCPLAYDPVYNLDNGIFLSRLKKNYQSMEERSLIQRLSLHAHSVKMEHPVTLKALEIKSPFPKDLDKVISILRKYC